MSFVLKVVKALFDALLGLVDALDVLVDALHALRELTKVSLCDELPFLILNKVLVLLTCKQLTNIVRALPIADLKVLYSSLDEFTDALHGFFKLVNLLSFMCISDDHKEFFIIFFACYTP